MAILLKVPEEESVGGGHLLVAARPGWVFLFFSARKTGGRGRDASDRVREGGIGAYRPHSTYSMKVLRTFTALHSGSWPVVEAILRIWGKITRIGAVYVLVIVVVVVVVVVFVAFLEILKWSRPETSWRWKLRMQLVSLA